MVMEFKPKPDSENPEEEFLKAFEDYSEALFRHASIRLYDKERAIEIVHDTFTKAWSYIRNGHTIESFRPFLYKILNNLIIDEYRRNSDMSLDSLLEREDMDESFFADLADSSVEALAATLDGKKAFEVLKNLPDIYREVLILKFVDGLGPKEISTLIEESENKVSVRIHRGLKMLRDFIEKEELAIKECRDSR